MISRRYFPLVTGVLWGTSYPAISVALDSFPPLQIALVRVLCATLILGPVLYYLNKYEKPRLRRSQWAPLIAFSIFGIGLFYLSQVFSLELSTPINVSFMITTYPGFVSVLAYFVLDEPLKRRHVAGVVLAMLGAYLIIGGGRLLPLFSSDTFLGDLIALFGALSFTVYLILNRVYADRLQMDQLSTTFYMILYTVPLLAIPTLLTGQYDVGPIDPIPAVALLWLAVVVTGLGYLTLNIGLTAETTTLTALRLLSVPLVSTLISVTMLEEPLTTAKIGGGALIALGILYPQLAPRLVRSEATV